MNEDAYLIDVGHVLFGVFDGLGATVQAAQAAQLAAEAIRAAYHDHGPGDDCAAERVFLPLAVRGAGMLIAATLEDGLTTASVVKVCNNIHGGATALICNIGDSRVYRYTTAGEVHQCTLDDSVFGSDWDLQLHLGEVVVPTGLLEYTYFERRHGMDRALGERLTNPHLWEVPAEGRRCASSGERRRLRQSHLLRATPAAPRRSGPSGPNRSPAGRRRLRPQPPDRPPRAKIDDITAVIARVRRAPPTSG